MAYLTHANGEQLIQTRNKAKTNFDEVVSTESAITAGEIITIGDGQGIEQFRTNCDTNFDKIWLDINPINTQAVIDDGDSIEGVRDKLNYNFSCIGGNTNLVTNGLFAADTDWTKGTGWSISGDSATFAGHTTISLLQQNSVMTLGTTYYLRFTVADYVDLDQEVDSITITSAGTGYTTADDHGAAVTIEASTGGGTDATGTLVVVGDVVTGVTITEEGTLYDGTETITLPDPTGAGTTATGDIVFVDIGTTYGLTPSGGIGVGTEVFGNGTYTQEITPLTNGNLIFTADAKWRGSVEDVHVAAKVTL